MDTKDHEMIKQALDALRKYFDENKPFDLDKEKVYYLSLYCQLLDLDIKLTRLKVTHTR